MNYFIGKNNLRLSDNQALGYMDRFVEFVTRLLNENGFTGNIE